MKIRKLFVCYSVLAFAFASALSASGVKAYEETLEIPTYVLNPAETTPIFDCDWSYQRARRSVYPYPLNDNMTLTKKNVSYKALYLENEYVKLCVLPEIGGRLFYAIDKTNNYDIFYHQDVIKPANVGMTGAWISGGVEWNVFHHHRNTSHSPVSYKIVENKDGSKTIWVGETELRHRMSWAIGVTLYPKKSYMEISGRLINSTRNSNSILFWANASTHVDENYQIIFPQSTEFGTFHCKESFCHWPITKETYNHIEEYQNNINASLWRAHPASNSIFVHDLKDDFIAGYDHGKKAGTILVGNHHIIKGGKFWSWGPNSGWPTKILTEKAGHYIELMSGAYSDNQPDYNWIYPYEVKKFTQYYYGIQKMGGVKKGSKQAAINMDIIEKKKLLLGANATERLQGAKLSVLKNGKQVYEKTLDLAPDAPFVESIELPEAVKEEIELTMNLYDSKGKLLLSYTPVKHDENSKLPEPVRPPLAPSEIKNNEECYLVGLRNLQFHNPFVNPVDYFEEVLKRDPSDTRCNTKMGIYWRQRGDNQKAEKHLRVAFERQTNDYTRPENCEATYNLGLVLKDEGRLQEAEEMLYRATWNYAFNSPANYQLAQLYVQRGDFESALERLEEAITNNGNNFNALNLKGAILRRMGNTEGALSCFNKVLSCDPINYYAICESQKITGNNILETESMFASNPELYLELALKYMHDGFVDDAVSILKSADLKIAYPTIKMWLGFFADKAGDKILAKKYFADALNLDIAYCNPFRLETLKVLELAGKYFPDNFKVPYYMGNIMYDKQVQKAVEFWNESLKKNPNHALTYRNLGWANWKYFKDFKKAKEYYLKTLELDKTKPIFFEEADQVLEASETDVAFRYNLLKSNHKVCEKRYYPLANEVITGIFVGDFDYVLGLLRNCYFPTREGVANFHDVYVDALVLAGKEKLSQKKYAEACELFKDALKFPENHQVFLYDTRTPRDAQIYYMIALAYELLGDKENALANYKKSVATNVKKTDYRYWKALSLQKLGMEDEAENLFEALVKTGKDAVVEKHTNFYGAEGTTGDSIASLNTKAHYTQALGEMGLGNNRTARKLLKKSLELKHNNLWAKEMLKDL